MTLTEGLTILAIVLGPILAIQVQKFIEIHKEKSGRKLWIFKALMASRGNPLSLVHVEALNSIDLEFSKKSKKEKSVCEKWKIYLDHLGDAPKENEQDYFQRLNIWSAKLNEHAGKLLYEMGKCLGYEFDEVHIKKGIYFPRAHGDLENEQRIIRIYLIELSEGKKVLPVFQVKLPAQNESKTKDSANS